MKNKCTKFRNCRPYTAKSLGTWKMFDNPTDNHTDILVPLYYKLPLREAKKHWYHCSINMILWAKYITWLIFVSWASCQELSSFDSMRVLKKVLDLIKGKSSRHTIFPSLIKIKNKKITCSRWTHCKNPSLVSVCYGLWACSGTISRLTADISCHPL